MKSDFNYSKEDKYIAARKCLNNISEVVSGINSSLTSMKSKDFIDPRVLTGINISFRNISTILSFIVPIFTDRTLDFASSIVNDKDDDNLEVIGDAVNRILEESKKIIDQDKPYENEDDEQ